MSTTLRYLLHNTFAFAFTSPSTINQPWKNAMPLQGSALGTTFPSCTYRRAEMSYTELRWDEKVEQCSDEMQRVEKNLDDMWEEMRWDETRRDEMRWSVERDVWSKDCEVWSMDCEVCSVKCDLGSTKCRLVMQCKEVVRRSCSWTTTVEQVCIKHAHTGLAGAGRMQGLWMKGLLV